MIASCQRRISVSLIKIQNITDENGPAIEYFENTPPCSASEPIILCSVAFLEMRKTYNDYSPEFSRLSVYEYNQYS